MQICDICVALFENLYVESSTFRCDIYSQLFKNRPEKRQARRLPFTPHRRRALIPLLFDVDANAPPLIPDCEKDVISSNYSLFASYRFSHPAAQYQRDQARFRI